MKLQAHYVGKSRDAHANAMAEEYIKRTTRFAKCEMREIQPRRFDPFTKHPDAKKILLDPAGRLLDSQGFIALVGAKRSAKRRMFVFVISGLRMDCRRSGKPRAELLPGADASHAAAR